MPQRQSVQSPGEQRLRSEACANAQTVLGEVVVELAFGNHAPGAVEADLATDGARPGAVEVVVSVDVACFDPRFGLCRRLAAKTDITDGGIDGCLVGVGHAIEADFVLAAAAVPCQVGGEVQPFADRHVVANAQVGLVERGLDAGVGVAGGIGHARPATEHR
uniref:Uncharacterized protein n=1 Tax=Panagrolaimus superbus TaxID=310955 RepID=A0A914YLC6_9BILA